MNPTFVRNTPKPNSIGINRAVHPHASCGEQCSIAPSGNFHLKTRTLSHTAPQVCFVTDKNEDITHLIIDDPYGNFRTDYQDHRGNDIRITWDDFTVIFNPTGNETVKWAHLVG